MKNKNLLKFKIGKSVSLYTDLKSLWKKLGIKGQIINYSSKELWVIETENGPVAHILQPGYKTPIKIDFDGFKRVDGVAIDNHKNWWKFYDFSIVEIFDDGKKLKISAITKTAVDENHFNPPQYLKEYIGEPIKVITAIKRRRNDGHQYYVSSIGWINFENTLRMVCNREIDNARPVFPKRGKPYIRTKRDKIFFNNLSSMG